MAAEDPLLSKPGEPEAPGEAPASMTLEEIQAAIRELGPEAAALVAARTAWRVMPILVKDSHFSSGSEEKRLDNLEAIQAAAAAGIARQSRSWDSEVASAAFAASESASDTYGAALYAAAAYAAAADDTEGAAYAAATATTYTADAAFRQSLLAGIDRDLRFLSAAGDPVQLAKMGLWSKDNLQPFSRVEAEWEGVLQEGSQRGQQLSSRWRGFWFGQVTPDKALEFLQIWHARHESGEAGKELPTLTETEAAEGSPEELQSPHVRRILTGQGAIQTEEEDTLGYLPVAEAVASFVTHRETQFPVTLSVEGEWGAGKSSFMRLLKRRLDIPGRKGGSGFDTVWFNPWRYENAETMWAAFALSTIDQLKTNHGLWHRFRIWRQLAWRRMRQKTSPLFWFRLSGVVLGWGAVGLLAAVVLVWGKDSVSWMQDLKNLWFLPVMAMVFSFGFKVLKSLTNPVTEDLKKFFQSPDYAEQATVLQHFHTDMRHIMRAYAGPGKKIAIFIDDLDRCEVPVASEMLRSLNLFFATDQDESEKEAGKSVESPLKMACFLGMDREKVAASIAAQHEKILPWLEEGSEDGKTVRKDGLNFGYRYLEKFINLVLMLPRPGPAQMKGFLDGACGPLPENTGVVPEDDSPAVREKIKSGSSGEELDNSMGPVIARILEWEPEPTLSGGVLDKATEEEIEAGRKQLQETKLVRVCAELAAPALGYNPRRLKQFLNLCRLRFLLAVEMGLYRPDEVRPEDPEDRTLTLEQIGKLVALEIASPVLMLEAKTNADFFRLEGDPKVSAAATKGGPVIANLIEAVPSDVSEEDQWRWHLVFVDLKRYSLIGLPSSESVLT